MQAHVTDLQMRRQQAPGTGKTQDGRVGPPPGTPPPGTAKPWLQMSLYVLIYLMVS